MISDDNYGVILLISSYEYKLMLWMPIRIASGEAILLNTHNIGFDEEIHKIMH